MLGTMGLPHVLVRFHTSPDGRAARRTAAITVALLGVFYLFPGVYGVLGARAGAGALPVRRDRHGRRRAARSRWTVAGSAGCSRRCSRGRVRGVPGHVARAAAGDVRRRRARPRCPARAAAAAAGRARVAAIMSSRWRCPPAEPRRRGARHAGLHRGRRRRSARCWCSASGGRGSPRPGRSRALSSGSSRRSGAIGCRPLRSAPDRGPGVAILLAATGTLVGAAGVRGDGRGLAAGPAARLGAGGHAAAAPGRAPFDGTADRSSAARPFVVRWPRAVERLNLQRHSHAATVAHAHFPQRRDGSSRMSTTDPCAAPGHVRTQLGTRPVRRRSSASCAAACAGSSSR